MKLSLNILLSLPFIASAMELKPITDEILSALSENGISAIEDAKADAFRKALLKALQQGTGEIVGLQIVPAGQAAEEAFSAPEMFSDNATAILHVIFLGGNIDDTLGKLGSMIDDNKAKALLIDLRNAGGDDEGAAKKLLDFCKNCKLPLGVLINGGTHAMSESLLPQLKSEGATIFGSPSSGFSGTRRKFALSNGSVLFIPQPKQTAFVPDVPFATGSQWIQIASDSLVAKSIILSKQP